MLAQVGVNQGIRNRIRSHVDHVVIRFPSTTLEPDTDSIRLDDFTVESAFGVTSIGADVTNVSTFARGAPVSKVLGQTGEWWLTARNSQGEFLVLSDPFGYQTLYYAHVWTPGGSTLLVGESSRDVARAMHASGAKVEMYWANILPTLTAKYDYFDCFYDNGTPIARVLLLPARNGLFVGQSGYSIVDRPSRQINGVSGTYRDLLEKGAEGAITRIREAVSLHPHSRFRISGGKDSRLVLALLLAGGMQDTPVETQDPSTATADWQRKILSADLDIVTQLVSRYSLSWSKGVGSIPKDRWDAPLNTRIAHFQRFRGGRSFQFPTSRGLQRFREPLVTISGAGGETIGSLNGWRKLGQLELDPSRLPQDALKLFRYFTSGLTVTPPREIYNQAANRFAATFSGLSSAGFDDANRRHYLEFRNRAHAGALRWSQWSNHVVLSPLLQPELIAASELLSNEERAAGKVAYDLIELLAPELNDLRFQSGDWDLPTYRRPLLDWDAHYPVDHTTWSARKLAPAIHTEFPHLTADSDPQAMIQNSLFDLGELMSADGLSRNILSGAVENPPSDYRGQGRLLTRLATALHCLENPGPTMSPSAPPVIPMIMTLIPGR